MVNNLEKNISSLTFIFYYQKENYDLWVWVCYSLSISYTAKGNYTFCAGNY